MTKFSFEIKKLAVNQYLQGIGSTTIARKLGIKRHDTVLMWVARYRKYGINGLKIRRSTHDYDGNFKLKVLNWKKQNQASYATTALKFDISNYGTIANWQRKFERGGVRALFTRRGRPRRMTNNHGKHDNQTSLSELERLRAENRALRVENEYLKKLDALVRKRGHRKKNTKSSKN